MVPRRAGPVAADVGPGGAGGGALEGAHVADNVFEGAGEKPVMMLISLPGAPEYAHTHTHTYTHTLRESKSTYVLQRLWGPFRSQNARFDGAPSPAVRSSSLQPVTQMHMNHL